MITASRRIVGGALALAPLVLVPSALGASLTATSPGDGVRVQTTDKGATINLAWSGDPTGCAETSFSVTRVFAPAITSTPTTPSANPSGSSILSFPGPVARNTTYTWYASTICNGTELRSEDQTFTLLAPRPHARLQGRFTSTVGLRGTKNGFRWAAKPRCATGTCKTVLNIPGLGNVIMRLNKKKKLYTGRVTGARAGRVVTCERNEGKEIVRGIAKGRLDVKLRVANTEVKGAQRHATVLKGRLVGTFSRNAKGAKLNCPTRYRLNQAVTLSNS